MKLKTLALVTHEQIDPERVGQMRRVWKVTKVTDSIEYNPEQVLLKNEVEALCRSKDWKVSVTSV
jgi:hypothetical protein